MAIRKKSGPSDNSALGTKISIRKQLLSEIKNPSVLDCFSGDGRIWSECYQGLPYLGLDLKRVTQGERVILNMDNRKYLRSADLSRYNVFDLDAYGSPWHQFLIIMNRRKFKKGERIAVFLTDGMGFLMDMSSLPVGLKPYIGIPRAMRIPALGRHQSFIRAYVITRAIEKANLRLVTALKGHNKRKTTYIGLLLEKCK